VLLQLNRAVDLHWRHWDSDWVVFDATSGHTHQMDELTACALLCIEEAPLAEEALAGELAAAVAVDGDAVKLALQPVLERLIGLGLVETMVE
jgi:PqqD family protein of HPr-rel-A system